MRVKTSFVGALACCVAVSAVLGPFSASIGRGDVNGDRLVNVLDAQTVVATLFAHIVPPNEAAAADVNNDGQVDVRDLQFILAHMNGAVPSELPVPSETVTRRAIVTAANRLLIQRDAGVIEIVPPQDEETRGALRSRSEFPAVLSRHTERYLFTLTANAPPSFA